jgi:predicted transcriptional regulator
MPTEQLLPRLPHDKLFLAALAVEEDAALAAEMAEWEKAALGDGLAEASAGKPERRARLARG